jgi:hypothetical protein
VLERATEAFFTTKAGRGGTGMGLAMAQEFATRNGGALRIDSTVAVGTTVEVLLPRAFPASEPDADFLQRRDAIVSTLGRRVRTPWLRAVLDSWHQACGTGALPRPLDVAVAIAPHTDASLVVLVDPAGGPGGFRLQHVGRALVDALAETPAGQRDMSTALTGSLGELYRRVAESRVPAYEGVRYSLGNAGPSTFERLVMPASADGRRVSHLVGLVTFSAG